MGLMLLPHNAPDAAKNVAYMVDEIWYHAGDTSTDVSSKIIANEIVGLFINRLGISLLVTHYEMVGH